MSYQLPVGSVEGWMKVISVGRGVQQGKTSVHGGISSTDPLPVGIRS
jgi:hypothetical protein